MNLRAMSEELKTNFSLLLSYIPLDKMKDEHIDSFIRFYKKLFLKLYKQFGIDYSMTLARAIGVELTGSILSLDDNVDFAHELERKTRTILFEMEKSNRIDHSKHSHGMSGAFYDSLNDIEREIYLSTFLDSIVGPGEENLLISISKTCVRLNIEFEDYVRITSEISRKYHDWYEEATKNMIGDAIKF